MKKRGGIRRLKNGITSDTELDRWCRENVTGFAGVISRTEFGRAYPRLRGGQSLIINLDPDYARGGTHWVALRISSEAPLVYYKDSFGAPPAADIVRQIKDRGLVYGNRIYQKLREDNCGRRAAEFLRDIAAAAAAGNEIEMFERVEGVAQKISHQ
jgi:hypothetical protein